MSNIYKIIFCWVLFISFVNEVKADHLLGMDANWRSLSNDTFEISLVIYRRCDNAQPLLEILPTISSDSCTITYNVTVDSAFSHTIEDITPVNAAFKPCLVANGNNSPVTGVLYGIERHTFKYKIYLGGNYANCCWYKIRYFLAAQRISGDDFEDKFWLNRCYVNTSPKFTNDPIFWRCGGQDVCYEYGIIDADNDSTSINLSQPLGYYYNPPYSYLYPLFCLGGNNPNPNANPPTGFNVSQTNCNLFFRPLQTGITIIKMEVKKWRKVNGQYKIIGITNRDLQLAILFNCGNKTPTISGPFAYSACSGQQKCITLNTNDQDTNDTTRLYLNPLPIIPNSTFTTNNGQVKRASGTFCWTPSDSEVNATPYHFIVTVSDDHLPIYGALSRSYAITVTRTPEYLTSISYLGRGKYKLSAVPMDTTQTYLYRWSVPKAIKDSSAFIVYSSKRDTSYQFQSSGTYIVRSSASGNGCTSFKYDTIIVTCPNSFNLISSNDTMVCKGSPVQLTTTIPNGIATYKYSWYCNGVLLDTLQTILQTPLSNCQYIVKVVSDDSCTNYGTDTINVGIDSSFLGITRLKDTSICLGNPILIVPLVTSGKYPITYNWYKNNLLFSTDSVLVDTPNSVSIYKLKALSIKSCYPEFIDSFEVNYHTDKIPIAKLNDTSICAGSPIGFTPGISKFSSPIHYYWYRNGVLIDTNVTLIDTPITANTYKLIVIPDNSCYDVFIDSFNVNFQKKKLLINKLSDFAICKGTRIVITPVITQPCPPINYYWYRNGILIDSGSTLIDTPVIGSTYQLKVIAADNCYEVYRDTFNVNFYVNDLQILKLRDTMICYGSIFRFEAQINGGQQPYNYTWYSNGNLFSSLQAPIYKLYGNSLITLIIQSSDICTFSKSDSFRITVTAPNQITITSSAPQIAIGMTAVLIAHGGKFYSWSGGPIYNNWGDSIEVSPTSTTSYKVTGLNMNDCPETSEIIVKVGNVGLRNSNLTNQSFRIFGNPSKNKLTIEIPESIELKNISIYDATGRELELRYTIKEGKAELNLESLAIGSYLIVITDKNGNSLFRKVEKIL